MADSRTLIKNLKASTAQSSITPTSLGTVLDSMMDDVDNATHTAIPTSTIDILFPAS
ncbi:MAG: hypothetical protein NC217_07690 [Muribaculaceae bacterium]|nr:hypothetical protein [Muribaculaceae bacterium]